jgi:nucleotide-binding universal stress UspA family protein
LDEREPTAHAFEVGIDLLEALDAEAALVHVVDPKLIIAPEGGLPASDLLAGLKHTGQTLLTVAAARVEGTPPQQFLREGQPWREIIAAAREWNADLIVLGTHGRSGLTRVLMGSTAEAVIRNAPCPVVVVRPLQAQ